MDGGRAEEGHGGGARTQEARQVKEQGKEGGEGGEEGVERSAEGGGVAVVWHVPGMEGGWGGGPRDGRR